jgi:hypothetical protein
MNLKLLQSMRVETSIRDFTLLGNQYRDGDKLIRWHVAAWSESDNQVRTYWVFAGRAPDYSRGEDWEVVSLAIEKWEKDPVWVN